MQPRTFCRRPAYGRFRFTAACKSHAFLKPRSASKRHAPTHLIVALATCMTKHTMKPATLPDIEIRTRKYAFTRLARGPSMLFKGKSLRLVTPQETPRHPHAALKGASGLLRDSSKSYGFHCRALKVFLWFHADANQREGTSPATDIPWTL